MQRIYLENVKFLDTLEVSEKELYHQLTRVMRARIHQEVIFFDGKNLEDHLYSVVYIDKSCVKFKRKEIISKSTELSLCLTLYQAYPNKLQKFEMIVQKCSEIGYSKIIFFESERSQKIVISDNKKERLAKISVEAVELCGGNILPIIEYRSCLGEIDKGSTIVCHTKNTNSVTLNDFNYENNINIIVGPEGGFSQQEIENIDAQHICFGKRILRCETVGEVLGFYISQKKDS